MMKVRVRVNFGERERNLNTRKMRFSKKTNRLLLCNSDCLKLQLHPSSFICCSFFCCFSPSTLCYPKVIFILLFLLPNASKWDKVPDHSERESEGWRIIMRLRCSQNKREYKVERYITKTKNARTATCVGKKISRWWKNTWVSCYHR